VRGESADGSDELPVNPSVRALGNPDVHMLALNGRAKTSALHVAALFRFASQCSHVPGHGLVMKMFERIPIGAADPMTSPMRRLLSKMAL